MAEKFVFCGTNCKYPALDKEETLAAIQQALEKGSVQGVDPEQPFITKIKDANGGKAFSIWMGTQAQYNSIAEKDIIENCLYMITDETTLDDIFEVLEAQADAITSTEKKVNELGNKTKEFYNKPVYSSVTSRNKANSTFAQLPIYKGIYLIKVVCGNNGGVSFMFDASETYSSVICLPYNIGKDNVFIKATESASDTNKVILDLVRFTETGDIVTAFADGDYRIYAAPFGYCIDN